MSTDTETFIGRLTDVQGTLFIATAALDETGHFPERMLDGEANRIGQLGAYVLVQQGTVQVLGRISRASLPGNGETNPNSALKHGQLELIPLGELDQTGAFQRGVSRFPTPGAEVHAITRAQIERLFADSHATGFRVGYLPSLPSAQITLNPTALFGRHTAILGQSGSGKSWGVANLIQRAVASMPNAHVILLDLHGEYTWNTGGEARDSAFNQSTVRHLDARELEIPYWLLTFAELVDLFVDRSEEDATTQIAFLREVVRTLRRKANEDMDPAQISVDTPVYFSLSELFQHFKRANEQTFDFGKTKGPMYGKFDSFLLRLQSRLHDVRYDFLYKPKLRTNSASLTSLLRDFVGLGEQHCQVTVIDLSPVPFDVRPTVSAQIGRLAFEFNFWNPRHREFPILLVCEEAHVYLPRSDDPRYRGTRASMERIAKEGRKYGVALTVVSQRPHELSETVLAQCVNFLCFRITNPDDQRYVRDLVPDAESNLIDTLAALGRGEVVALGEAVPIPMRFQMYKPDPPPSSSDIDLYTHWKAGPEDLDVAAIVDNWRRQRR